MTKKIHDAICYAGKRHAGQVRKGTPLPYLVHPMEVMGILIENGCDENVVIAGILHDVIEDTCDNNDIIRNIVREEIRSKFGEEVLKIVDSESEDKHKSWKVRKQTTIDSLPDESLEAQMVCCADKLSNMRSIESDLRDIGEKLWTRFNAPKENLAWYYFGIVSALEDSLHSTRMWKELKESTEAVFGR